MQGADQGKLLLRRVFREKRHERGGACKVSSEKRFGCVQLWRMAAGNMKFNVDVLTWLLPSNDTRRSSDEEISLLAHIPRVCLVSTAAFAHVGVGSTGGFLNGFTHPDWN